MNLCKIEYNGAVIKNITGQTESVTLDTTDKVAYTDITVTSLLTEYNKSITDTVTS